MGGSGASHWINPWRPSHDTRRVKPLKAQGMPQTVPCASHVKAINGVNNASQNHYTPPQARTAGISEGQVTIHNLNATTAHEARREIAAKWPDKDVYYRGYNEAGSMQIMGLVRRKGQSSGRLGGKPKKPGVHTPIRFEAEVS